jgi:Tfp pilus assembly protein PilN
LKLFNINVLPQRYRRRKIRLVALAPWLAFILLLAALYPSSILAMRAQSEFGLARNKAASLQATVENFQANAAELDALQAEIDAQIERRDQILASYQGLELTGSAWSNTLFLIYSSIPEGIQFTQIIQQEGQIHLDGIAESYGAVLDLLDTLQGFKDFHDVQIDSVEEILPEDGAALAIPSEGDDQSLVVPEPSYSFTLTAVLVEEGEQ